MKKSNALRAFWFIAVNLLRVIGYKISNFVRKNNNLWLFGSAKGSYFFDNSKYFFFYMNKNQPDIRSVWLTKNKKILYELRKNGYEAYMTNSIKGFLLTLRAGCVVLSYGTFDVNPYLIGKKTLKIQLFHGTPLKKIGYDDAISYEKDKAYVKTISGFLKFRNKHFPYLDKFDPILPYLDNYDAVFASSDEVKNKFLTAFNTDPDKIFVTGFPRTDIFKNESFDCDCKFLNDLREKISFKYVFSYIPTYREDGNIVDIFTNYQFNPKEINEVLEELQAVLIIKLHPRDLSYSVKQFEENSNRIFIVSNNEILDVYPLLKNTDVLLTDYSSVYFDFLMLDRPIVFTPFDIDKYLTRDRELYYEYDSITPGFKAKNWPETFSHIQSLLSNRDNEKQMREKTCKMFNKFGDGKSSERVYNTICELLKK